MAGLTQAREVFFFAPPHLAHSHSADRVSSRDRQEEVSVPAVAVALLRCLPGAGTSRSPRPTHLQTRIKPPTTWDPPMGDANVWRNRAKLRQPAGRPLGRGPLRGTAATPFPRQTGGGVELAAGTCVHRPVVAGMSVLAPLGDLGQVDFSKTSVL